ncbi:MAG: LysM domain-containing protein [Chloroflexi bacterium]|nr:LysM domain-containing protein [Chloroflexota bacterium]
MSEFLYRRKLSSDFYHLAHLHCVRLLIAPILLFSAGIAQAAEIYVDGLACQLQDAITAANSDTAVYGCSAGAGADTLILTRDVKLQLGDLPSVTSDITIEYGEFAAQACGDGDDPTDEPPNDPPPANNPPNDPTPTDDPPNEPTPTEEPTPTDVPPNDPPNDPTPTDDPPNDPNENDEPTPTDVPPDDPPNDPPDDPPNDPPNDPPDDPSPTASATATPPAPGDATPTATASVTATADGTTTATVTKTSTPSGSEVPGIPARCLHIVSYGETLYRIALKYVVTVNEISSFNNLLSNDRLLEGQELIIPHESCIQYAPPRKG